MAASVPNCILCGWCYAGVLCRSMGQKNDCNNMVCTAGKNHSSCKDFGLNLLLASAAALRGPAGEGPLASGEMKHPVPSGCSLEPCFCLPKQCSSNAVVSANYKQWPSALEALTPVKDNLHVRTCGTEQGQWSRSCLLSPQRQAQPGTHTKDWAALIFLAFLGMCFPSSWVIDQCLRSEQERKN